MTGPHAEGSPADREGAAPARPLRALLCMAVAAALLAVPLGLPEKAHATLAIVVCVAGLWITEALPLGVSAILVPVLATVLGVAPAKSAFAGFGDPVVFMFFGTFLFTDAASRLGLDRRLAGAVLGSRWVAARPERLLFAIAFLGFAISAWVNNTATTALLLPLALTARHVGSRSFLVAVLLMTSYAPSLGGLATPVGTAPNMIGRRLLTEATGTQIDFARWTLCCAPLALLATIGTAFWLRRRAGAIPPAPPAENGALASATTPAAGSAAPRSPWTLGERLYVLVAGLVLTLWIVPGVLAAAGHADAPWLKTWRSRLPEDVVPLLGALLLFLLPRGTGTGTGTGTGKASGERIADASVLSRVDWNTLLLFGGGMSLGAILESSGLAKILGQGLFDLLPTSSPFGIALAGTLMAVVVSELTSNTASANLVVPVVLELARAAGTDPVAPAVAATLGCSFGFMLPVSTPPNAIVYGTGLLRIGEMVRTGLFLDVAGAVAVALWVTAVF